MLSQHVFDVPWLGVGRRRRQTLRCPGVWLSDLGRTVSPQMAHATAGA